MKVRHTMTINEMLNLRFIEYDGMQFQKLFYEIMRNRYGTDFDMPTPYGIYGDYKCDGYLRTEGAFYACYAPENPSVDTNASEMKSKITSDLEGLIKNIKAEVWKCEFKKFVFVVNMKSKRTVPSPLITKKFELEKEIEDSLGKKCEIDIITQYDLSLIFNELDPTKQRFILEKVYINDFDFEFDGSVISKIIEYFSLKCDDVVKPHNIMELEDKIKFNNLSEKRGDILLYASFNNSSLQNYLEEMGEDACDILQSIVLNLYQKALKLYPDNSNFQFDYICEKLYPLDETMGNSKSITNSKYIIMSLFFENCSIFKSEVSK